MHDRLMRDYLTRDYIRAQIKHHRTSTIVLILAILLYLAIIIQDAVRTHDFRELIYLLLNVPFCFISFFVPQYIYRRLFKKIPEADRENQTRKINRKIRTRPLLYAALTFLVIFFVSWLLSLVAPIRPPVCIAGGLYLFLRVYDGLCWDYWSHLDGTQSKERKLLKKLGSIKPLESLENPEGFED